MRKHSIVRRLAAGFAVAFVLAGSVADGELPGFSGVVEASRRFEDRIEVKWNSARYATSVAIWRGTNEVFSRARLVATVAVTSGTGGWSDGMWADTTAVVKSAPYFTPFYYWVEVKNAEGSTIDPNEYDYGWRSPGLPEPSPILTVHPGGSMTGIELSWKKSNYAVTYDVRRSLTNGTGERSIGTVSGTSTNLTFTDTSTAPGVEYLYRIVAENPAGVCHGSLARSWRGVYLSLPADISLSSGAQYHTVSVAANTSWTATKESGASWLTLTSSSGTNTGSFGFRVTKNTTASSRTARLTVQAAGGTEHPVSRTINVTQAAVTLAAPTGVQASDGTYTDRIRVSWNASGGATSYVVCRSDSSSGSMTTAGISTSTSFDDTGADVVAGKTYWYWVAAQSGTAESPLSASDTGWKKEGGTPSAWSVYRFYSKKYQGHFFTIDEGEKQKLVDTNPNWQYECVAYRAFKAQASGTKALHRFYSKKYRGHFYTTDEDEKNDLIANNPNWDYEGVGYYVYPGSASGRVPVYRFWSKKYKHHFYTTDEKEKNDLIATNPNWSYEKIAFYALPPDGKSSKAAGNAAGKAGGGAAAAVAVTTSDGSDGAAVADGDETTGWSPETADASWVVLSFAEALEVADVEVAGENLPEGTRILLSEDADGWTEEVPGVARYVWVAFPAAEEVPVVREIRVAEE
jgi:fibronectin type 3 domain-containing protein